MTCRLDGAKPLSEPMLEYLLIGPLRTNFSEILSDIHSFSCKKMHVKMSSAKWRPFCLGLNVLRHVLITWKCFRHQWLLGDKSTGHWWISITHCITLVFSLLYAWRNLFNKQSGCRWFHTPRHSRHISLMESDIFLIIFHVYRIKSAHGTVVLSFVVIISRF